MRARGEGSEEKKRLTGNLPSTGELPLLDKQLEGSLLTGQGELTSPESGQTNPLKIHHEGTVCQLLYPAVQRGHLVLLLIQVSVL